MSTLQIYVSIYGVSPEKERRLCNGIERLYASANRMGRMDLLFGIYRWRHAHRVWAHSRCELLKIVTGHRQFKISKTRGPTYLPSPLIGEAFRMLMEIRKT